MQNEKQRSTSSGYGKNNGFAGAVNASSSTYTPLDRNPTDLSSISFRSTGAGTSNGPYVPMMQRWLEESRAEQPYNNIGQVGERRIDRKGA
ncbi:hypothetical protein PSPO01_01823 [Paraphaeosphaeria sporulosa]